jgi:sulfur-oxidizing protein SoxZ
MASALINVPAKARRGDIIEIKTLMSHIMETGYRHMASGELVPRDIITSFTCRFNGSEIFRADLYPAIAANPFITFFTTATESGKFEFEWTGDQGFSETARSRSNEVCERHSRCAADRGSCVRHRDPASRPPLRLRLHEAGHQGDAG